MSKSSELDKTVKLYIIDHIDPDYCGSDDTPESLISGLKGAFYSEYSWRVDQVGEQKALTDWLQGLPSAISLPFYNGDILDLAVKWGSIPADYTEKQADKILENYFGFMANKIGQLFRGYRVPKVA